MLVVVVVNMQSSLQLLHLCVTAPSGVGIELSAKNVKLFHTSQFQFP